MTHVNYCHMAWMGTELTTIELWYHDHWYLKCHGYIKMSWKSKSALFLYVLNFNATNPRKSQSFYLFVINTLFKMTRFKQLQKFCNFFRAKFCRYFIDYSVTSNCLNMILWVVNICLDTCMSLCVRCTCSYIRKKILLHHEV